MLTPESRKEIKRDIWWWWAYRKLMMKQWLSLFPCLSFCHDQVLMRRSGKQWSWWRCMSYIRRLEKIDEMWWKCLCGRNVDDDCNVRNECKRMNERKLYFSFGMPFVDPSPWAKSITPLSCLHKLLSSRKSFVFHPKSSLVIQPQTAATPVLAFVPFGVPELLWLLVPFAAAGDDDVGALDSVIT